MATAAELALHITAKDDASKTLDGVGKTAGGLGKTLGDVGKIAGGFLAANVIGAGVSAFTGFIGKSINEGIKLGESLNAVNKIFGETSVTILEWGKANATSFGLSQAAFNQMAVPLGASLKNAGLDMDLVADATISLTERAADMASVFNVDVGEALAAIQSGLRGEADPLEAFGVGLSAAKVETRALADSGKVLASTLTDQEKMMARMNIIFDETSTSQGDFAATSGEAANAARIQTAKMEELQATIGTKLIPVQLAITKAKMEMVSAITDYVLPVLGVLGDVFGENQDTLEGYSGSYQAFLLEVQKVAIFVRDDLTPALRDVAAVVEASWPTISAVIEVVNAIVIDRIAGMVAAAGTIIDAVGAVVGAFNTARASISSVFNGVLDGAIRYFTSAINSVIGLINSAISAYNALPLGNDIGSVQELSAPQELHGPGYAAGTPYVPATGWAMLHKGEAVIPAAQNRGGGGEVHIHLENHGTIVGIDNAEAWVAQAWRNVHARGGFYGAAPA